MAQCGLVKTLGPQVGHIGGMTELTQQNALLVDIFGRDLLEYLCACNEETITRYLEGEGLLNEAQEEVVSKLTTIATDSASAESGAGLPIAMRLGSLLGAYQTQAGTSNGNILRQYAGGSLAALPTQDPVTLPLASLMRDIYPLMLLPGIDPRDPFPLSHAQYSLYNNPSRKQSLDAIRDDPDLSRLIVDEDEGQSWVTRSTGGGGTIDLNLLPSLLITGAWWRCHLYRDHSVESLTSNLTDLVNLLRSALRGDKCEVTILVGLVGVIGPENNEVELPYGRFRSIRESEREMVGLKGGISHTVAGEEVKSSYSGDAVLEVRIPYSLEVEREAPSLEHFEQRHKSSNYARVDEYINDLQLAFILTQTSDTSADDTFTLIPVWRMALDPLLWSPMQGVGDPTRWSSIVPRRVTADRSNELSDWAHRIHTHSTDSIGIAKRRIVSASLARTDAVDSLVDLVVAWENLFGQGPELTLRISASLAWLLGQGVGERRSIQSQVATIYGIRSRILHGSRKKVSPQELVTNLATARDLTRRAMRTILRDRPELLGMDASSRSIELIMGNS